LTIFESLGINAYQHLHSTPYASFSSLELHRTGPLLTDTEVKETRVVQLVSSIGPEMEQAATSFVVPPPPIHQLAIRKAFESLSSREKLYAHYMSRYMFSNLGLLAW
jgi:hypothetical protein